MLFLLAGASADGKDAVGMKAKAESTSVSSSHSFIVYVCAVYADSNRQPCICLVLLLPAPSRLAHALRCAAPAAAVPIRMIIIMTV